MPLFIAIAVSTAIFSGIWATLSMSVELITFAGFLSWSTFFSAGGQEKGLKIALITNLSGVIWGFLMSKASILFTPYFGDTIGTGLAVAIGAGAMCLQSRVKWLGFIPGAFIGCSTYFATGFNFGGTISGLVLGVLFGYLSQKAVSIIAKRPLQSKS